MSRHSADRCQDFIFILLEPRWCTNPPSLPPSLSSFNKVSSFSSTLSSSSSPHRRSYCLRNVTRTDSIHFGAILIKNSKLIPKEKKYWYWTTHIGLEKKKKKKRLLAREYRLDTGIFFIFLLTLSNFTTWNELCVFSFFLFFCPNKKNSGPAPPLNIVNATVTNLQ